MVISAFDNLQNWWRNFSIVYVGEIREHFCALLSIMGVQANKTLIMLLMEFWDPTTVTFKILDFEITLTLKEVSDFAELPLREKLPLLPSSPRKENFLRLLRMDIFSSLRNMKDNKIKLDYLFQKVWSSGEL